MMNLAQLASLHRRLSEDRVLSVYIDGSAKDPAQQRAWRTQLDIAIKDIREWLAGSPHDERMEFERAVVALENVITSMKGRIGASAWVAFVNRNGVVESHTLPAPVPTLAVWSNGPAITPYVRALKNTNPVVVVVADSTEAFLFRYQNGEMERLPVVHAHHVIGPTSHMGGQPRQGFHTGTRGSTGKDAAQRSLLEGRDRMIRECAERARTAAGRHGFIAVGGIKGVARKIVSDLMDHDRVLELKSLDIHSSEAEILQTAKAAASEMRASIEIKRLAEITEETGAGGLGVFGLDATRTAVEEGSIRDLYVSQRFLEENAVEAERLVRGAIDHNSLVEVVSGEAGSLLEKIGGVAAGLRFKPALSPMPAGTAG